MLRVLKLVAGTILGSLITQAFVAVLSTIITTLFTGVTVNVYEAVAQSEDETVTEVTF